MRAVILKEFRELARDRRTLAMLVALPVILLVIFGYAANFSVDRASVIIVGSQAQAMHDRIQQLPVAADELELEVVEGASAAVDPAQFLKRQEAHAVIVAESPLTDGPLVEQLRVEIDGSSLFTAQSAQASFVQLVAEDAQERARTAQDDVAEARAASEAAASEAAAFRAALSDYLAALPAALQAGGAPPPPPSAPAEFTPPDIPDFAIPDLSPDTFISVRYNPDLQTSWVMVPGLTGLILLFVGALITSIGLVRERETGTLEQLAVMPLRPTAIIFGKITPYFLLALLDMAVVTALGVWLFAVPFTGSLGWFTVATVVFLLVVLGVGVLISSVSQSTGQAIQMAIMFVVPQVLLSGLIFPLDAMPLGVRWIGYLLPLTWFREVSQGIMLRDAGIDTLWFPITVLAALAVVVFGAAVGRMRRSLTHGGTRS